MIVIWFTNFMNKRVARVFSIVNTSTVPLRNVPANFDIDGPGSFAVVNVTVLFEAVIADFNLQNNMHLKGHAGNSNICEQIFEDNSIVHYEFYFYVKVR